MSCVAKFSPGRPTDYNRSVYTIYVHEIVNVRGFRTAHNETNVDQ